MPDNTLGFLLADNARLYRQNLEKAIAEAGLGLTSGEIRALAYVGRYLGARQATIAERMGVEPMTLSAYLDRLELRGLITRSVDPSDRRAKVIHTTEAADQVFEDVRPLAKRTHAHATQGISPADLQLLEAIMMRMRSNLSSDALAEEAGDEEADASPRVGRAG